MNIGQIETPADVSAEMASMSPALELVTCLMGGTATMRAAGKTHLPRAPAESEDMYIRRLAVSTLYGAYRRTIETLAARPFAEPIQPGDDVPPKLLEMLDDVDLEGRDLQAFAHGVFATALACGLSHILVEYPTTPAVATLAEEKAIGARPYFVHLDPRNVLGWRAERIAGVMTLTMLRIRETVSEPTGQWSTAQVTQVRVLERTKWTTYRQNERKEWVLYEEGPVTIGVIPLATVYTGRTDFLLAEPPLLPLAYLNIEHWQSASDQQNILHVARVPILFAAGFEEGALAIGVGFAVQNDDPTSKLSYVEHSGAAIEAGRQSLLDLEERMGSLGAELLVADPEAVAQTATQITSDDSESTSLLSAMVNNLEDTLAVALGFMARWAGLGDKGGSVELKGDFTVLNPLDVASLVAAKEAGILSAQTVFLEFQRLGMIDEELTWEDEAALLAVDQALADAKALKPVDTVTPDNAPAAITQPLPATPPADFGPLLASISDLVAALGKPEIEAPEAPIDFSGLIAAIGSQPAPIINIAPASVTVEAAQITVNVPEQPAINIAPSPAPIVNIAPAAVNVTIERNSGAVTFTEDAAGNITGAAIV